MEAHERVQLKGKLQVIMNGALYREFDNLVVDVGKEWVAGMMTQVGTVMSHMEVGAGTNVAAVGQVALTSPIYRKALQTSGGTLIGPSVQYSCTYGDGEGDGALTEAGLFDNASGGTMLARTVFDIISKGSGDVMTIVWTITVA